MKLKDTNVLVLGLGRSGVAAALFLYQQGARVAATDLQPANKLIHAMRTLSGLPIRLTLGHHPEWLFEEAELVVLSPGVPLSIPQLQRVRERGTPIIAEVELAARFLRDTLVAVTGSNGKSTTTALTAHLLNVAGLDAVACGNIGTPLTELVPDSNPARVLSVELSSFQLETIEEFHPRIATVLNITPDHMDRYDGFDAYKEAKLRVFLNQGPDDFAVINADECHAREIAKRVKSRAIHFGAGPRRGDGMFLEGEDLIWELDGTRVPLIARSELNLKGPHNLSNSMAAAAMALLAGAKPGRVAAGLRTFQALEHRLEPVAEIEGVHFVNDSKATNVDSTAVALQSFDAPLLVIMGGKDKEGDFASLNTLLRAHAREVILIGQAADKIDAALEGDISRSRGKTLEEAVKHGFDVAQPGDVILLAPGCASFDMFDNFEHRGREFKRLVRSLQDAER